MTDPLTPAQAAFDSTLRAVAFARVAALQRRYQNEIPWSAIAEGITLPNGQHLPLSSKAEGIYKPKGHPAALSVKTTMPRRGRSNPYDDEIASDAAEIRYARKAHGGPNCAANRGLRVCRQRALPLIYFWGVGPSLYSVLAPVYVVDEDDSAGHFLFVPGARLADQEYLPLGRAGSRAPSDGGPATHAVDPATQLAKRYTVRQVRQRLHQRRFRHLVLDAYGRHCAMCSIKFDEFLEAAHIVPDKDERGRPEVRNGLALCSLHHNAFDRYLVDVTPDYRVQLSADLRARRDGPVFQRAFLERDGQGLYLPKRRADRPGAEFLAIRHERRPADLWTG